LQPFFFGRIGGNVLCNTTACDHEEAADLLL